jgi:hypothetical protein
MWFIFSFSSVTRPRKILGNSVWGVSTLETPHTHTTTDLINTNIALKIIGTVNYSEIKGSFVGPCISAFKYQYFTANFGQITLNFDH